MSLLLVFLLAAVASFLGSLQPGPVNLAVAAATLRQSKAAARAVALGGSVPEFGICLLIGSGIALLQVPTAWQPWLEFLPGLLLVVLGLVLLHMRLPAHEGPTGAAAPAADEAPLARSWWRNFAVGLVLGGANIQLPAFWAATLAVLRGLVPEAGAGLYAAAAPGAFAGAYLLHLLVIRGVGHVQLVARLRRPLWWAGVLALVLGCAQWSWTAYALLLRY